MQMKSDRRFPYFAVGFWLFLIFLTIIELIFYHR